MHRLHPTAVTLSCLLLLGLTPYCLYAQQGTLLEKKPITSMDTAGFGFHRITVPPHYAEMLEAVEVSRITYLSDGLQINGYLAMPRAAGTYPCLIYNRSGVHDFGIMTDAFAQRLMGEMASWGYVVVESQLRGCGGSEGTEAIGGAEIRDILHLIPLLAATGKADTSRIGMYGRSRGGYSTYQVLAQSHAVDAAIIIGGNTNFKHMFAERPRVDSIYCPLIPGCTTHKDQALHNASPVNWADKIPHEAALLIMHGAHDARVPTREAFEMVDQLQQHEKQFRFVFFENANHGITQFRDEVDRLTQQWLDLYVKNAHE